MKDARKYCAALENGNPTILEELAYEAGYIQTFKPFDTKVLRTRPGRYFDNVASEANDRDDMLLRTYFWAQDNDYHGMHPIMSMLKPKGVMDYTLENSPRTDWNKRYKDFFTKIKETEEGIKFVDCWEPKQFDSGRGDKNKLGLMKGKFTEGWYDWDDKELDEETAKVIQIARFRERYPPLSRADLLSGPNWEWALGRLTADAWIFVMSQLPFIMAYKNAKETGFYVGIACVGLLEAGIHKLLNNSVGSGFYKKRSIETGEKAVGSLIKEIHE